MHFHGRESVALDVALGVRQIRGTNWRRVIVCAIVGSIAFDIEERRAVAGMHIPMDEDMCGQELSTNPVQVCYLAPKTRRPSINGTSRNTRAARSKTRTLSSANSATLVFVAIID
jgi:hypothetical protein